MKQRVNLYKASNFTLDFRLRKQCGSVYTIPDGYSLRCLGSKGLRYDSLLWDKQGTIVDSTSGHVSISLNEFDTSAEVFSGIFELRLENSTTGYYIMAGQMELRIRPSFDDSPLFPGTYSTFSLLRNGSSSLIDQTVFEYVDYLITDETDFHYLFDSTYNGKTILIFSPWKNHNRYKDPVYGLIDAPGDLGMPNIQNSQGDYVYEMDDIWSGEFVSQVFYIIYNLYLLGQPIAGVMLDDYYPSQEDYGLTDSQMRTLWRDRYEDPDDLFNTNTIENWNNTRLLEIEFALSLLVPLYCTDGVLIVNGPCRSFTDGTSSYGTSRLHLNPSLDSTDIISFSAMTYSADSSNRLLRNDFISVDCIDSSGYYGMWYDSTSGTGRERLEQAAFLSIGLDCNLGISYGYKFPGLYSKYSLIIDPDKNDERWFYYYKE